MSSRTDIAPCGTYNSRRRHRRNNETCETCGPLQPAKQLAPCGTKQARERHRRKGETCEACDNARHRQALAPCGTPTAKRRHRSRGETCTTCGPMRPYKPRQHNPCGTEQAHKRHKHRKETCHTCQEAHEERVGPRNGLPIDDLINEARFLLNAGEGEARILDALGYTGRTHALRTRLIKAGHTQLATAILNPWDLAA